MAKENEDEQYEKVIALLRSLVQHDEELRAKYEVGDKFRFVRDRLLSLAESTQKNLEQAKEIAKKEAKKAEEMPNTSVYVYLFNAQGLTIRGWVNMLTPKVFYEYSINRPIYADKNHVESLVRSKSNKLQHAYLTVAISDKDIVSQSHAKDALDHSLLKVKEGSLKFENFVSITHGEQEYVLDRSGELIKKLD